MNTGSPTASGAIILPPGNYFGETTAPTGSIITDATREYNKKPILIEKGVIYLTIIDILNKKVLKVINPYNKEYY